jgi:isoleucyl-tRNA synthetase
VSVVLAKDLVGKWFGEANENSADSDYFVGKKIGGTNTLFLPTSISIKGTELKDINYEQLLPYAQPEDGDAFRVITGNFVTTEDGTGIVHIAPSFGADDRLVAQENGIGSLTLVDKQGKFVDEAGELAGRFVKNYKDEEDYESPDITIAIRLKTDNKAFAVEKYEHTYPHCWRTDKPILYYPLDSWFVNVTAHKDKLVALNKTINWKPASTGEGRFGQWLENLVDWNLSRSRYWGIPLPIWKTEDGEEEICIGSYEELRAEVEKAKAKGWMKESLSVDFDPHKPYVDEVVLVSESGKPMQRESDLIDVWFDSGAMPYAQWHYPFENQDKFEQSFPADFIAEGVDQTRGWFYTLHVIATLLFDSVAYKNVVSNGLVLDKNGNKMSKRLGNAVDPFETLASYGADATRWYMISNAQPWDNLKFDVNGIDEVRRKLFGTLFNTYSFFALYANIDGFDKDAKEVPMHERPEIDRWVISLLHSLIQEVDEHLANYEPTKAARAVEEFVVENLSNWYVRLCRRRFWKSDDLKDKQAAYQTLFTCLKNVAILMSPIAPFFPDFLFKSLMNTPGDSIHLADFPTVNTDFINKELEEQMQLAQQISSMVLSLRKNQNIKVRQPLQKIMIPVLKEGLQAKIENIAPLILSEVNVKEIDFVTDTTGIVTKKVKPNFKILGKKLGGMMKAATAIIQDLSQEQIAEFEKNEKLHLGGGDTAFVLQLEDVEILSEDIEGWLVAVEHGLTVALDIHISSELEMEGRARELVNRIQKERKEMDLNVTDKIEVILSPNNEIQGVVSHFEEYIKTETLTDNILFQDINTNHTFDINGIEVEYKIIKHI